MATISRAQQIAQVKRLLSRMPPGQAQPGQEAPQQGMMQGSGTMGQTPEGTSFGAPTDMHGAMMQAESAWEQLRGVGHQLWGRIHPELKRKGQPADSFIENYTKYLMAPNDIANPRVRGFLESVTRQLGGDDSTVQLPEEQNPALQAMSLGDPDATNLG